MAKLNWIKYPWPCHDGHGNCQELVVEEKPGFRTTLYNKHVGADKTSILGNYHSTLVGVFSTEEEADAAVLDTIRAKIAGLQATIIED